MKTSLRCVLGRLQADRADPEEIKREGWRDQQILVVSASDNRLNWIEREQVKLIGEKLYGTRSGT